MFCLGNEKKMEKEALKVGVNLGGWISQYQEFDYQHFDTFILEDDIQRIGDWGFDHVRLPVDYPVLEDDANLGQLNPRGMENIDNCLQWCQRFGLRLVLDLHRAPGYSFTHTLEADGTEAQNTLFTDLAMGERFVSLWEALTRRYLNQSGDDLAFELLNEMVLPDSSPWNALAQKTINAIRRIDPQRLIVVGGNYYNSVEELQNIELAEDPHLLCTFHFYLPMTVTHQKASWVPAMREFNQSIDYPGTPEGLEEFLDENPQYSSQLHELANRFIDKDYLREALQPAIEHIQRTGHTLYCGEFGVIDQAPMDTRVRWNQDFCALLRAYNIGYAYWTYKALDFGLVDEQGQVVSKQLIQAVTI
jgi:hypothetical protein